MQPSATHRRRRRRLQRPPPCRLRLIAHSFVEPLPPILPGALPALQDLHLDVPRQRLRLPPSWGADAAVLPALTGLTLALDIEGPLPREWARGFQSLQVLQIRNGGDAALRGYMDRQAAVVARLPAALPALPAPRAPRAPAGMRRLPPEWERGFPALRELEIASLPLDGSIPEEWTSATAFPLLQSL